MKTKIFIGSVVIFITGIGLQNCGSKSSSSSSSSGTSVKAGTLTISTFPTDFVVASPVAPSASTSLLLATEEKTPDYTAQKEAITAILDTTDISKCTFTLSNAPANSPTCYGPSLDFKGHPDFTSGSTSSADGNFPGGDLGMWTKYSSSDTDTTQESCVSAKMNSLIGQSAAYVGNAEMAMAYLQCIAKNTSSVSLPTTVGDSVDLLTAVTDQKLPNFTFSAANISYSADYTKDDGTTSPIYISSLTFSNSSTKVSYTINLKHTTTDSTKNYYRGKLWVYAVPETGNNTLQKTAAYSVMYEKEDTENITYSVRNSNFVTTATESDMFDSDKTVKTPVSNDGYNWGIFSVDPTDGTGKVAYAWVAGTVEENARSFIASVSADSSGTKTGVGYFGFGDSMKNILSEYTSSVLSGGKFTKFIDRMICNWAGPNNQHTGIAYVQKQEIAQDTTGLFKPTSSKITYVPRNSCGMGTSENNTTFTYRTANTTSAYGNFGTPDLVSITTEKAGTHASTFDIPTPPKEF